MTIGGSKIAYTATAGHLVTVDPSSSKPDAKMFYVAFTQDGQQATERAGHVLLQRRAGVVVGVRAARVVRAACASRPSMPTFTPPAPYPMEDNPDSLLDKSDLVFINPVGTGYSAAIAPNKNSDFWGVDQDANSLKQFIKRYLTKNNRWNSPKFLFGESYGTARSCVLAYVLHEDGVDLNGVTLQSSILDYSQAGNPVGAVPTPARTPGITRRLGVTPAPTDLRGSQQVVPFAQNDYANALAAFPNADPATVRRLSQDTGIYGDVLTSWEGLDVGDADVRGTLALPDRR